MTLTTAATLSRATALPAADSGVSVGLHELSRDIDGDAAAQESIQKIESGARVVLAGQQPGLCGGPLLTTLKAIGAIKLARELTEAGVETVPLFWNASTDHDQDEMNRLFLPSTNGLTVDRYKVRGWLKGVSASRCIFDNEQVEQLLSWLADHAVSLNEAEEPRSGESLARWQSRLMAYWFRGTGMVVLEPERLVPHDTALKHRILKKTEELKVALLSAQQRKAPEAPILVPPQGSFLFEEGPPRRRVHQDEAGNPIVDSQSVEAMEWLTANAASVSGDVAGRVLLQQGVLPVVFQVAGPSERLYIEEMVDMFDVASVPRLSTADRPGACVLTASIRRDMSLLGVTETTILEPGSPQAAKRSARGRRRQSAEAKALERARHRQGAEVRQRTQRVREWVQPRGRPQERTFPLVAFGKDRQDTVRRLMSEISASDKQEVVVLMDETDE